MGIVYAAEQRMGSHLREVALKTLHPELSADSAMVTRFMREAGAVAQLEHQNTVRVYDFGETSQGALYIAMEFVRGEPLSSAIERGPMDPQRVVGILRQVSGALHEAHELGIIHRDLKPDNIVLSDRAGEHDFVKLLDFGIASRTTTTAQAESKLTQQGTVLGTPPYMSPEQFSGELLDRRTDIYALGIIAYEMLTGHLPFEAETPWQWAHHHMTVTPPWLSPPVPERVARAVAHALSKLRDDRPANLVEWMRELQGTGVEQATAPIVGGHSGYDTSPMTAVPTAGLEPAPARTEGRIPVGRSTESSPELRGSAGSYPGVPTVSAGAVTPLRAGSAPLQAPMGATPTPYGMTPAPGSVQYAAVPAPGGFTPASVPRRSSGPWGWVLAVALLATAAGVGATLWVYAPWGPSEHSGDSLTATATSTDAPAVVLTSEVPPSNGGAPSFPVTPMSQPPRGGHGGGGVATATGAVPPSAGTTTSVATATSTGGSVSPFPGLPGLPQIPGLPTFTFPGVPQPTATSQPTTPTTPPATATATTPATPAPSGGECQAAQAAARNGAIESAVSHYRACQSSGADSREVSLTKLVIQRSAATTVKTRAFNMDCAGAQSAASAASSIGAGAAAEQQLSTTRCAR